MPRRLGALSEPIERTLRPPSHCPVRCSVKERNTLGMNSGLLSVWIAVSSTVFVQHLYNATSTDGYRRSALTTELLVPGPQDQNWSPGSFGDVKPTFERATGT